ncbi:histidine kinase [Kitasatospora sp. SolWspMP-SS2h]|nr:histidine kinase [Kitasatospora sp. SolWspMP-SS2h]
MSEDHRPVGPVAGPRRDPAPVPVPVPAAPAGVAAAVAAGGMSVELPLWRAMGYFRVLALAYAVLRYLTAYREFLHPVSGWIFLGALSLWTLASIRAFAGPQRCTWLVLGTDLTAAVTGIVMSGFVDTPARIHAGAPTLPTIWAAGTVLGFAGKGGWRAAAFAGAVIGAANILGHGGISPDNLHNIVLLLLAGCAIGYVIELARASEAVLTRALQVEAATRERERLSRDIHDGVLQVLALVHRQQGDAAELGRLAGEQERALRALMAGGRLPGQPEPDGEQDLRPLLARHADERITLAAPATPVPLPAAVAAELAAAVAAALDNVRRHAGEAARAWILVEDEPDAVTVSVRDDGPGFPAGRLAEAQRDGRLGVAQSIRGRMLDLGGSAELYAVPGQGVEVELRWPRRGHDG